MELEKTVEELNVGSRKKNRTKSYADKDPCLLNLNRTCNHPQKSKFRCLSLRENDIILNRKLLYKNQKKIEQDNYLSRLISTFVPERRRSRNATYSKAQKNFSAQFFLLRKSKPVIVCKKFFSESLSVTRGRLDTLLKTLADGKLPRDGRGGDRISSKFLQKKDSVINFIKKFPATESHYNRAKSARIYLRCDLNIDKLFRLYNSSNVEPNLKVKRSFFRLVFKNNFNIGFQSPASDTCTYCMLLKNKFKTAKDEKEKQNIITEKRIHTLRYKAFYDLMKEKADNSVTFCFDMQHVQVLPRTPIQEAFYSRQISYYVFCVVGVDSLNPLFYTWTEIEAGRGATEIGSALINFLQSQDLTNKDTIKLFCDGCGGQNKNSHIVHVILFWLQHQSPQNIRHIQLIYPVRGHSFLPADRVFGRIEKEVRNHSVILNPKDYDDLYGKFGKVLKINKDWPLINVKDLEKYYKKIDKIQTIKKVYFEKKTKRGHNECIVKIYENYKFKSEAEVEMTLLKRGKTQRMKPILANVSTHPILSDKKSNDVKNLLVKQFGDQWANIPELQWYTTVILNSCNSGAITNNDDTESECNCLDIEYSLKV